MIKLNFSPETLIQIYLDGSFTEEAQAEFDRLMRHDPNFADKVTQAVAARVGPVPEASLDQAQARLDARIQSVWRKHKPSPYRATLKKASVLLMAGVSTGLVVLGYQHLGGELRSGIVLGVNSSSGANPQGDQTRPAVSKTLRLSVLPPKEASALLKRSDSLRRDSFGEDSSGKFPSRQGAGTAASTSQKDRSVSLPSSGHAPASQGNGRSLGSPSGSPLGVEASLPKNPMNHSNSAQTQEGDALRVEIETDKTQEVVVTVLDSAGMPVRGLYRGLWEAGVHWVDWDGKDNSGASLPPGSYTVVLNADGKLMSGVVTIQPTR